MDSSGKKIIYYLLIVFTVLFALYVLVRFALLMLPAAPEGYQEPLSSAGVRRGTIYDRTGEILAAETPYYSAALMLQESDDLDSLLLDVSSLLQIPFEELRQQTEGKSRYALLVRRLSEPQRAILSQQLDQGLLPGIVIEKRFGRSYPQQHHGAQLVGFTNIDNAGIAGVEYQFDRILSPLPDPARRQTVGRDIYLTIDNRIQYAADERMEQMIDEHEPDSAVMIIADARTGEVLSWSSYPWFNLNEYATSTLEEQNNRPVTMMFEPGSVFKVFSLAAVLAVGEAATDKIFLCNGSYTFTTGSGRSTTINCLSAHGEVGPEEMLKYSCNGAISYYALGTPAQQFYDRLISLGFNTPTGIQLPGESSGSLRRPELWSGRSRPTIAFGQEIGVTAMQIVQAATALTNSGVMLRPRIIAAIGDERQPERIIANAESLPAEIADEVLEMMKAAAEPGGTAVNVSRNHIEISAKTGTSQVLDLESGSYSADHVIASTLAILPADDPRYIIYAAADNPQGPVRYGSAVAAPMIGRVIDDLVSMGLLATDGSTLVQLD